MKIAIAAGSILLAFASRADAQPELTSPAAEPGQGPAPTALPPQQQAQPQQPQSQQAAQQQQQPEQQPARAGEPLREDVALELGISGTVGSWALMLGTFYFGENGSLGDFSVVTFGLGALGILIAPSFGHWYAGKPFTRGLGVRLAGAATVVTAFAVAVEEGLFVSEPHAADRTAIPPTLAITGAVLLLAGTLDDLATTPRRVRRWNRAHGFAIAPIAGPHAAGFALGGRF